MADASAGLLERSSELGRLRARAAQAAAGNGSVVIVEGPAGIGKTSLLAAGMELAANEGFSVLTARAGRLERDLSWNLVRQLFAGVIASAPRRRDELLDGAAALAAPALGLDAARNSSVEEAGILHGLYWLTAGLAARQALLLAVDDAHWGDSASVRYLSYLSERASDLPVLILLSMRSGEAPSEQPQEFGSLTSSERLVVHSLSETASADLTRTTAGFQATDEFCQACHEITKGNPFLLQELLRQLGRDGIDPTTANSAAEVARVTPQTVRRAVLMRLSTLDASAHELARAVAVMGDDTSLAAAAALAELDLAHAARAADSLTAADILAAGTPLRFVHPLVRDSVYAEIPAHQRAVSHGQAARVLAQLGSDPQRVAIQLLEAHPAGDEWAVAHLREAAAAARSAGAREPAVDFLRRALAEPPDEAARVAVLRELSRAEALTGSAAAIDRLQDALVRVRDPREKAEVALELVLMLFRHGQMDAAVELCRQLIDEAPPRESAFRYRVIAAGVTGAILVPTLRPYVDFFLDRVPPDLPGESPEERLALSARLAARLAGGAKMDEVGQLAARALGGEMLLRDLASHELLYWNAASALIVADRFAAASSAIESASADAQRRGSVVGFALASCFRSLLQHRLGRITGGVADGRHALAVTEPREFQIRAYAVAFLIDCLIERGELDDALALAGAPEFAGALPPLLVFDLLRLARGRLRIAAGDAELGVEELLGIGEAGGASEFGPAVCPWRARAAVGLCALGKPGEARRLAEDELSWARRTGSGWGEVLALQALALASPERGEELLGEAGAIAERRGFALERARALVMLGAAQRRQGRRRAAAEQLEEGLRSAIECGGAAVEERARSELVAIGLAPRRRAATGTDALTPAERRVADLAASGMSNREIAQSLFVSLRTVETHLTHSYQKLGIASREQLDAALATA